MKRTPNKLSSLPSNNRQTMRILLAAVCMTVVSIATVRADASVEEVQRALKDQGFYYGEITGKKDADTIAAIRRYQIRNGLEINGELNQETLSSIQSSGKTMAQSSASGPAAATARAPQTNSDTADPRSDVSPPQPQPINPPQNDPSAGVDSVWGAPPIVTRTVPAS